MRVLQLLLIGIVTGYAAGANVLAVLPSVWTSHYIFGLRLLQQFVSESKNHSVTIISPHAAAQDNSSSTVPRIREIRVEGLRDNWIDMGMSFEPEHMRSQNVMERFTRLIYAGTTNVDLLLSDAQVRKLLTSGEQFDLLVVDLYLSDALLGLAFYYGIPTVAISPTATNSWLNSMFGNPQAAPMDPSNFLPFTERMSTRQRIINTLMCLFERLTYNLFHMISQELVYARQFEELVQGQMALPHHRDLTKNLSLALINSQPLLHYPRAYLPNMLEIGGIHLFAPTRQLPNHLLDFIEAAPSGVIYMSLGADVRTDELPSEKLSVLLDVFAHLKEFHILLKWESSEFIHPLPDHIMINDWWPQQAILAHPQVKVFISSCGLLSVWESIAGRTPILAIPILPEQEVVAKRLHRHGASITINYDTITYDALLLGIRQLTLNATYNEHLEILRHRMAPDDRSVLTRALHLMELVVQTGGADYLKSHTNTLNFWRAEGIDVLTIIALGLGTILIVPFMVICCILRRSYHSEAAQVQRHRATLQAVGRVHSYSYSKEQVSSTLTPNGESPSLLRRTRSAQSLGQRSSSSSCSSTASPASTPSTASTTPLDVHPPIPSPSSVLYMNPPPVFVTQHQQQQTSHDDVTKRQFL